MAYDEGLLTRCLDSLRELRAGPVRNKNTFGMRGLLRGSRMFAAVGEEAILVKLTEADYVIALQQPGVSAFAPDGGRPMSTWVLVDAEYVADDPELREWLAKALGTVS